MQWAMTRGTLHLLKKCATLTLRADRFPLLPPKGAAKTLLRIKPKYKSASDIHITTV